MAPAEHQRRQSDAVDLRDLDSVPVDLLLVLERNIPDLTKMSVFYMALGTQEELREQIIQDAIDSACLQEPLPTDDVEFRRRMEDGKSAPGAIGQEVARLVHAC